jgi:hypothetical protein
LPNIHVQSRQAKLKHLIVSPKVLQSGRYSSRVNQRLSGVSI